MNELIDRRTLKPEVTGGEALLVGLFVSLFVDQGISRHRMLKLLTQKKLSKIYKMIEES